MHDLHNKIQNLTVCIRELVCFWIYICGWLYMVYLNRRTLADAVNKFLIYGAEVQTSICVVYINFFSAQANRLFFY